MKILVISGSAREDGNNQALAKRLPYWIMEHEFSFFDVAELPLFRDIQNPFFIPNSVEAWRNIITESDALVICTPEYIHNIPAAIKNALEWVYASGELADKVVLPIVFTPKAPRGDRAMESLLFSLKALEAKVVTKLHLYHDEFPVREISNPEKNENLLLLKEAFQLLSES